MARWLAGPAWAALVLVLTLAGCQQKGDGLSDYERMQQSQKGAAETLRGLGAKIEERHYPQGDAWAVNLSGQTITEDVLKQVQQLGKVSELNLSRSTITDDQLDFVNQSGLVTVALKVDLSHTAVTDAGLEKLTNMVLLRDLNLAGTKVTPAAVERFKQARQEDTKIMALFKNPTIRR